MGSSPDNNMSKPKIRLVSPDVPQDVQSMTLEEIKEKYGDSSEIEIYLAAQSALNPTRKVIEDLITYGRAVTLTEVKDGKVITTLLDPNTDIPDNATEI